MTTQINGIELDALNETVEAFKNDPELGQCRFRATNRWQNGTRNVGKVETFYAAKQEQKHKTSFETFADEPPLLAGGDSAANPVEHLLMALAACVTTSMVAHAAVRGIVIDELESQLEGDIDLNGFLGLASDVPAGFQRIRITFTVTSDASADKLEELARFSPVFNTIVNGAPIDLKVEKRQVEMRGVTGSQQQAQI